MNPKISIITVVYNGERYLDQAIRSVLAQTYQNKEYIIIDGGSTDGTVEIIKKHDSVITRWISEPDAGIYDAMNKGIAMAQGELIGILNSDDWYDQDTLQKVVKAYNQHPDGDVFHGLLRRRDEDGNLKYIIGQAASCLSAGMIEHPTCFVKKSVYQQYGGFDTSWRIAADYELMLRLKKQQAKFVLVEEILANFRGGGISDSFQQTVETLNLKHKFGLISVYKKYLLLLFLGLKRLSQ